LRACTERPQCSAGWLLRCETFNSSFSIARWSVWILSQRSSDTSEESSGSAVTTASRLTASPRSAPSEPAGSSSCRREGSGRRRRTAARSEATRSGA
jgi:hypothetical protein